MIKLYQNYFSYENTNPPINKGDLVYSHSRKRVFQVKGKGSIGLSLNYKFPKGNEKNGGNFIIEGHKFYKINPNLSNGRNTSNNIENYVSFLKTFFGEKFPFITDFKNKTLVVAEKGFFKESKFLPLRYTNKKGKIIRDLPFFSYMIECCNDFDSASSFLLNNNEGFDEIIIIGDSKYRNSFDLILQEKYRNKYKNIILIGTEKPNSENQFLEWRWSNDEIKIANNELPNETKKIKLNNSNLYSLFIELKQEIQRIKDESNVNLAFILKYANFFLRMILVNTNLSKGIFQEYLDRLNRYFLSESFSEELNNRFYTNNIYNPDAIKDYTKRIFDVFSKISNVLENENLKWNYIKRKAKENQTKKFYLIIEKKNYDAVYNQIKNEKVNNILLISEKRIDNSKLYLDKWLNDEQQNSHNRIVIVPYLNNLELYAKIKSIKGNCEILCYENLDEISFDNVEHTYQNQEKGKLNHTDRTVFFKTNFTHSTELKKRELDDIFSFKLDHEEFKNDPYESLDSPKEKVIYEIVFDDDSKDKFDSSKGIFLVENREQIKTSIGEIYSGATIRFYKNNSKEEFRKILKIFDTDNLLDSFDEFSESWKNTLKKLAQKYGGVENLYYNLFTSYKININTFRLYFEDDSKTRFPRIRTLECIREFCVNNSYLNELIVTKFDKFKIYSKKDHSIRQQAGKILGNDLLDYVASNKEEKSDSLQKFPNEILEKLTATIQEKTIIKKTLLYE
ncbi:hypothetical protein DKB58_05760 [Capnocytophaga canimorsus]|nr:hypothetical protein DKB58_05760 [Capnocytophaga canimorsus]